MPVPGSSVGREVASEEPWHVDTRWLLGYAAGVGDCSAAVSDTAGSAAAMRPTFDFHERGLQGTGVVAHPVFAWALEWPLIWLRAGELFRPDAASGEAGVLPRERGTAVHYAQDIVIHRPIRSGSDVRTRVKVVQVGQRRQGSLVLYRFQHDGGGGGGGALITSWNASYFRGVDVDRQGPGAGELADLLPPPVPRLPERGRDAAPLREVALAIGPREGVVYGECARIWNPIHSDTAAAQASGLPQPILHGTATMAKCVTAVVAEFAAADARRVKRVRVGRFAAPVLMPSVVTLRVLAAEPTAPGGADLAVYYEAVNPDGAKVLTGGLVVLSPPTAAI